MEDIVISSSGFEIANYNVNKIESENNKGKLTLAILTASIFVFTPTATKQNFYSQPENNYLFEDSLDDVSGEVFYNNSNSFGSISFDKEGVINMPNNSEYVDKPLLDEVKAHFDTKLDSLESNIKAETKAEILESEKRVTTEISNKIDQVQENRKGNWRFLLSSVVIPLISAVVGALLTWWLTNPPQ